MFRLPKIAKQLMSFLSFKFFSNPCVQGKHTNSGFTNFSVVFQIHKKVIINICHFFKELFALRTQTFLLLYLSIFVTIIQINLFQPYSTITTFLIFPMLVLVINLSFFAIACAWLIQNNVFHSTVKLLTLKISGN